MLLVKVEMQLFRKEKRNEAEDQVFNSLIIFFFSFIQPNIPLRKKKKIFINIKFLFIYLIFSAFFFSNKLKIFSRLKLKRTLKEDG